MIYWGDDNAYPNYAYEAVNNSPLLHSIIKGSIDFTLGDDPITDWDNLLAKITADRWYFGGFCIQVLRNTLGQIVRLEYIDIRYCRLTSDKASVCVLAPDSLRVSECLPRFDADATDPLSIYFYTGSTTRETYPVPEYSSSLIFAEIQAKIGEFHYNTLDNNFNVSAIINFNNGGYAEDLQNEIERKISTKFAGASNAGKFLLAFNDSKESAVTIERLQSDDFDSKYQAIQEACERNIFTSMRAMPQLFGLNYASGFAPIEYQEAYKLYYRTAIKPKQNEITACFEELGFDIIFKPFTI